MRPARAYSSEPHQLPTGRMKLGGATGCRLLMPDPNKSPEVDLVGRAA
jgi:hypothetical protein